MMHLRSYIRVCASVFVFELRMAMQWNSYTARGANDRKKNTIGRQRK